MARVDFERINRAALDAGLGILLRRWLPDGQVRGEEFQRDGAFELHVGGLINHTHPTFSELLGDLVVGYGSADHDSQIVALRDNCWYGDT